MNIDQTDLKIIRRIESKGLSRFTVLARELNLPAEEIKIRIKQLEASRFIKGYGLSLFFPPLAGGDWYWVLAQMETQRPIKYLIHHLKQHLPYITEISFHRYLSRGACPNVTALFYTRNLRRDLMLIKKIEGVDYVELYRIKKFTFPVRQELSKIEIDLLYNLSIKPTLSISELADKEQLTEKAIRVKLDKLLWDEENKRGIVLILPNLDWTRIHNFTHIHLGLTTELIEEKLIKLLKKYGIDKVPYTPWFKKRYFQIERDIWGIDELIELFNRLDHIRKVEVMGMVMVKELKILDDGVGDFIKNLRS